MASRTPHVSGLQLQEALRAHSLKVTPQRMAVHEAMTVLVHAGADQVAGYISTHSEVRISVPSVYNILTQFSELGIYAKRMSPGKRMVFDINTAPHLHIYDSRSDELVDVADNGILEMVSSHFKKRKFPGYKADSTEILIVCHPTRKKRK